MEMSHRTAFTLIESSRDILKKYNEMYSLSILDPFNDITKDYICYNGRFSSNDISSKHIKKVVNLCAFPHRSARAEIDHLFAPRRIDVT